MSIAVMSRVWDKSAQKGSALILLLALADFSNDEGICWPSVETLAHKARITSRQAQNLIGALEASGELYCAKSVGRTNTSRYYVATGASQDIVDKTIKGEIFSSFKLSEADRKRCNSEQEKVKNRVKKGEIAISPDPSVDPSVDPIISQGANAPASERDSVKAFQPAFTEEPKPKRKPKTPTDPYYVFQTVDGKSVYTGPFKGLETAKRFAAGNGTVTQKQAIPPGAAVRPVPRPVQPWEALGKAIARTFFGATDDASVNAVMGRVAPILHGDKRGGRCMGIIAYECERQKVDRERLDFAALAAFVPVVWAYYQTKNPGLPLKDCAKVLDYWQARRVLDIPAAAKPPLEEVRGGNPYNPNPDLVTYRMRS